MKKKKRRMELFSFCDRRGIENHLEKMAEKGWLLEKISTILWTYRRIEPQKIHFCVTFYPDASEFAPGPSEKQQEFQDFCAHTGWNLAVSRGQMLIFSNERDNPVPIETEPEVEIEAIHEGMVKMTLIPYGILLVMSVLFGGFILLLPLSNPTAALTDPSILFLIFDDTLLFLLCIVEMSGYLFWRYRAQKAAEHGEFLDSGRWMTRAQKILVTVLVIGCAGYLICLGLGSEGVLVRYILMVAVYFAGLGLVNVIRNALRERKVSSAVNKVLTFVFSFVFYSLFYTVIIWATLGLTDSKIFASDSETYEYRGDTFTAYHDELPLTVSDLLGISDEGYSMRLRGSMTPLAQETEGSQEPRLDAADAMEMPELDYTVTKISVPVLYEWCRDDLIREKQDTVVDDELVYLDVWERSDASPWKAEEAYRRLWSEGYLNEYLLFYEDRIIQIRFDWEPDGAQMQTAAEKLLAEP